VSDQIWQIKICIDPAFSKLIPGVLCRYIFQPSISLVSGGLINNIKNWISINIYNVNIDAVVEFHIISQYELESA
jgi:hypothetical protein